MKKNLTEIVFILDRSGSMSGLERDTIGGFNAMLEKQRKQPGTAYVSTILFDHTCEVLHDRVNISEIEPMTEAQYTVRGSTALLDAIGASIDHIAKIHKYAREEDRPEKTIFIITTDGYENSSRNYSYDEIRRKVSKEQDKYGWEFLFLGANIDAVSNGAKLGIREDRSVTYKNDACGVELNYTVVSDAVSCMRMSQPISRKWKSRIEDDVKRRGR